MPGLLCQQDGQLAIVRAQWYDLDSVRGRRQFGVRRRAEDVVSICIDDHGDTVSPASQGPGKSLDANGVTAKTVWRIEGGQHAKSQAAQSTTFLVDVVM